MTNSLWFKRAILPLGILIVLILLVIILIPKNSKNPSNNQKSSTNSAQISSSKKVEIPTPTLETIFAGKETDLSKLDKNKIITLIATGDVIPARGANWPAVQSGNFHYNWEKTADYLKRGDITLINLEAPLMKGCPLATAGFTFCGDSRQVEGMVFAGVDVANITNNHIGNYGQAGITETINLLEANKIAWSGFSHLGTMTIKGTKFGFLGYNGIGVTINREEMQQEIRDARGKVDVLIVSVHWGKEYESLPLTDGNIAPDNPVEIGHLMIEAGADLVIGNHPHWVQGVEFYQPRLASGKAGKGKLITYAHGNFIFDQTWSIETQEGVVGTYTFFDGKLIDARFKPVVVDQSYQPVFVEGERAAKILKRMSDSSNSLAKQPK